MRVLVCNDDGIEAPGLALLAGAAEAAGGDVWVLAPEVKHTAASSSLTLASPLTMRRLGERRYSCSGRPADCVVAAMAWLFGEAQKPALVLSGVNDGRNVAEDLAYSGTLGVAREAAFWGVPAIAFSRVKNPSTGPRDGEWLAALLRFLWARRGDWTLEGHFLSVNLPASLPAGIRQPGIGRDKIARRVEVRESDGERTVIVIPRGRAHTASAGDENSLIDAGFATINRLNWFGETRLDESLFAGAGQAS